MVKNCKEGQTAEAFGDEGQRHCAGQLDSLKPRQMGKTVEGGAVGVP